MRMVNVNMANYNFVHNILFTLQLQLISSVSLE